MPEEITLKKGKSFTAKSGIKVINESGGFKILKDNIEHNFVNLALKIDSEKTTIQLRENEGATIWRGTAIKAIEIGLKGETVKLKIFDPDKEESKEFGKFEKAAPGIVKKLEKKFNEKAGESFVFEERTRKSENYPGIDSKRYLLPKSGIIIEASQWNRNFGMKEFDKKDSKIKEFNGKKVVCFGKTCVFREKYDNVLAVIGKDAILVGFEFPTALIVRLKDSETDIKIPHVTKRFFWNAEEETKSDIFNYQNKNNRLADWVAFIAFTLVFSSIFSALIGIMPKPTFIIAYFVILGILLFTIPRFYRAPGKSAAYFLLTRFLFSLIPTTIILAAFGFLGIIGFIACFIATIVVIFISLMAST
ncbi:MAG: hypothetical protein Q7R70_04625 [Candidatus Diapherotrites archaeon]|nr:hypothetical protein [Candidatus Diapherotrites archaeon]